MKISKRELAQLSAFLDGELSQRDQIKLQHRIDENPGLQATLDDLRTVKTVLTHTPRLLIPRNFKLKQSMVESSRRSAPMRGYRLAAAVMSFLFIGVVVLDIGSGSFRGGLLEAQAPMAEDLMMEVAADEMEESSEPVMEKVAEEAAPAEMEAAPLAPENLDGEGEVGGMAEEEPNYALEETARAVSGEEDAMREESPDIQSTPSPLVAPEIEEAPIAPDQDHDRSDQVTNIPWLRILELSLGLGAVGFAIAGWRKRKINRE